MMLEASSTHIVLQDIWQSMDPESVEYGALILVTQRNSNNALYRELIDRKDSWVPQGIKRVFRIGDCVAPGLIADAVFDGHRLAREIDSPDPEVPRPFIRERRVVDAKFAWPGLG
jgi:dimethylamine/trimethylamine dehydrogenase